MTCHTSANKRHVVGLPFRFASSQLQTRALWRYEKEDLK